MQEKIKYESPVYIDLIDMIRGYGAASCNQGLHIANSSCAIGWGATSTCGTGNTPGSSGTVCTNGNSAAGACSTGTSATSSCSGGSGVG